MSQIVISLLRRFVPGPIGEELAAELESEFCQRTERHGRVRAWLWLLSQVFSLNTFRIRNAVIQRERLGGQSRTRWWTSWIGLGRDLHTALRAIRRAPGYAVTVITTFALAAGANVAVFSVVNGVLLRPLPYAAPGELVTINRILTDSTVLTGGISHPDYVDWAREVTTVEHIATYARTRETYFGENRAEEWLGLEVSPSLFSVLGVRPLLGRTLQEGVDQPLNGDGLVISYQLWQSRFAADSGIVGRLIQFEDRTMTVVGVMPADFYFPSRQEQYWSTFGSLGWIHMRGASGLYAIARLAPGVTQEEAQQEMSLLAARTDVLPDAMEEGAGVRLIGYHDSYVGHTRRLISLLSAAVAVVLLIACANIANLGLTRASVRKQEFAVRAAIGAGPWRIMRLLLIENVTLACFGAIAGVALALGIVYMFDVMIPADLPRSQDIRVDATVLFFATGVAALSGIVFGLAPALKASAHSHHTGLRNRTSGLARDRHRTIKWLVVFQVGLSQVLVIVAGLLLHSFARLSAIRPGFDTEHTLTMRLILPRDGYEDREDVIAFHESIVERMRALPGVVTAGLTSHLPFSPSDRVIAYWLEDGESYKLTPTSFHGHMEVISQDYLEAMGIPIREGRTYTETDGNNFVLINEQMAERHWPDTNSIGKQIRIPGRSGQRERVTVLGVVGSVLKRELTTDVQSVIYVSLENLNDDSPQYVTGRHVYLVIRTAGAPESLAQIAPRAVTDMDHDVVVTHVQPTARLVTDSIAEPRFRTLLIGAFAAIALVVALVGVYGVMSFVVVQRTTELGVRMALGARADTVLRHVLSNGMTLILCGIAGGTAVALGVSRFLSSILFDISPNDPVTLAIVSVLLMAIGAGACYLPARRASRVNPMTAVSG